MGKLTSNFNSYFTHLNLRFIPILHLFVTIKELPLHLKIRRQGTKLTCTIYNKKPRDNNNAFNVLSLGITLFSPMLRKHYDNY